MSEARPPSAGELEDRFSDYFRQMAACRDNGLGWALLHLVLVMPDICAALAAEYGWTTAEKYQAWCERYMADAELTGADWRVMRGIVLHQGRTAPGAGQPSQYSRFEFEPQEGQSHRLIATGVGQLPEITLNVGGLEREVLAAMRGWFADVERGDEAAGAQHVRKNLEQLVRVKRRVRTSGEGIDVNVTSVLTTSSTAPPRSFILNRDGLKELPPRSDSDQ